MSRIAGRVGRALERQGYLERNAGNAWLVLESDEEEQALLSLQGRSVSYRIAVGPNRGKRALRLEDVADGWVGKLDEQDGGKLLLVSNTPDLNTDDGKRSSRGVLSLGG